MDCFHAFFLAGTDEKHLAFTARVDPLKLFQLFLCGKIFLIKTDHGLHLLVFHHDQKMIQKVEVGLRPVHGEDHQRLIHVGHGRADQGIFPGKDLHEISCLLFLIQDLNAHIIPHQGLDARFSGRFP